MAGFKYLAHSVATQYLARALRALTPCTYNSFHLLVGAIGNGKGGDGDKVSLILRVLHRN